MNNKKKTHVEDKVARQSALNLLKSPAFFPRFLRALEKGGLVGEQRNALVLLVATVSRLLSRPLNVFVKGSSSAGKNFLVKSVLRLLPKDAVAEITSASDKAFSYSGLDFRHKIIYLQEQNNAAGNIHPIRLLISEGKVVRIVSGWKNGKMITKRYVAHGPVASISTTTKNRLADDDENRHISIPSDSSVEQTRQIIKNYTRNREELTQNEIKAWRTVHKLLEEKIGTKVTFPSWFEQVEDRLYVSDLRVRRYYPAFVEAVRSVCLIRSFQPHRRSGKNRPLTVKFADFAITAVIFDEVFVESLRLGKGAGEATRRLVQEIATAKGTAVQAEDISAKLRIPLHQAYAKLRYAEKAGVIRRANTPEKSNRKRFLPTPRPRFVPDPEELFRELKNLKGAVRFIHPITGEWVRYQRED